MDIIVDPEFERLLRPLAEQEYLQLECSVLDDGLLSPLIVWAPDNILLDGHHRLRICRKHDIPFATMALAFDSREQALQWVRTNQEGRRNLTPEEIAYVRGNVYRAADKQQGVRSDLADVPVGKDDPGTPGTSGHCDPKLVQNTAERLAKGYDVSPRTVKRDAQFAEALDVLADILGAEFRSEVLAGTSGLSKQDIIALSEMSRAQVLAVADDRKAMKSLAKEWRSRADEPEEAVEDDAESQESVAPDHEAPEQSFGTQTDEVEHLRAAVATYRGAMESIVEVCRTDEVSAEGLRQLLDEVEVLAEEALAAEDEDTAPEATQ